MDKQCKEWCLISHPENKSKWIWKVSMFRNVHHSFIRPCLEKMASGTWRCMDDFRKKDFVKGRQSHIDVKFPCLKFTMTPVLLLSTSELLSLFWEKNEFHEIVVIFKMTEGVASLLKGWSKIEIKTLSNWTWYREKINSSICFEGLSFLVIGSLSLAAMNTKWGSHRKMKLSLSAINSGLFKSSGMLSVSLLSTLGLNWREGFGDWSVSYVTSLILLRKP